MTEEEILELWDDYTHMDKYYDYDHRNFVDYYLYQKLIILKLKYAWSDNYPIYKSMHDNIENDYIDFINNHSSFIMSKLSDDCPVTIQSKFALAIYFNATDDEVTNRFRTHINILLKNNEFSKVIKEIYGYINHRSENYAKQHLEDIKNERRMETDQLASGSSD